tara:strand:- start:7683 stop:8312 length:630 start_codon:yes stop_codon:yes gene_type:complete
MKYNLLFIFGFISFLAQAQEETQPLQLSGIVMSGDSIPRPIPFAHVYNEKISRGTMTDAEGFFSFAVLPGDTVIFSCIGFQKEKLGIPDTLNQTAYLARIQMQRDTTLLEEVTLYPWPSRDRFKEAFLATNITTTANDIAMRNLASQALKDRAAAMGISPEEAQDMSIRIQNQDIYNFGRYSNQANGGTAILGALTNPLAWHQLFQSFK